MKNNLLMVCLLMTATVLAQTPPQPAPFKLPAGVALEDGLTEDEAVAIALWNNAALQADLSALGLAKADLINAGLLHNPTLQMLLPLGYSQFEMLLNLPTEVFWQRKRRVAAAQLEFDRLAKSLEQNGLNLTRDVRVAYVNLWLAGQRTRLADEAQGLRQQIYRITQARLRVGDVSELEANATQVDLSVAAEQAARFRSDIEQARSRLMNSMGAVDSQIAFELKPTLVPASSLAVNASTGSLLPAASASAALEPLIREAFNARPDLRGAALAIEAAAGRAKWERSRLFTLAGLLSIKRGDGLGFSPRPGLLAELPIFHRNKGGITRADAEVELASRQYLAVRQQIALEVHEAFTQYRQAFESLDLYRSRILPETETGVRLAEQSYRKGEESYLFVLENTRRLVDARMNELDLEASLRRAQAQLSRSIGKKYEP